MANGPADSLSNTLKDTLIKPVKTVIDTVDKIIPDSWTGKKPVDTSWHDQQVREANKSFGVKTDQDSSGSSQPVQPVKKTTPAPKKYHKGTDYVPETGPAVLKKGEAVLNTADAGKFREAKNKMAKDWSGNAKDGLAGKTGEKPPKEISHIVHHKIQGGGHHFEHHHTHPDHHPVEHHYAADDDGMVHHMLTHAGTPNPGEAEAEAGTPENYQPGASPNAAIEAAASPAAMAGPSPAASPAAGPTMGA